MAYSSFHNHTTFCDGKDTPEAMVRAAIEAGMPSIGFSGHSYTYFDESYCMQKADIAAYQAEIRRLQQAYDGQIRILSGIEQDLCSAESTDAYDFVIGSMHYLELPADLAEDDPEGQWRSDRVNVRLEDGRAIRHLDVDNTFEEQAHDVATYFDGDYLAYAEAYFEQVSHVIERTGCTFVGHFDLVTKFNEDDVLFDTTSERYRSAAIKAARTLCQQGALFEINTGAMAKGYRTTPYPAPFILDVLAQEGARVVLSTDAHTTDMVQFGLAEAEALALAHGLEIVYEL